MFFLQLGPIWIFINLFIAFFNSNFFAILLIAIRDSWVVTFLILLLLRREWRFICFFFTSFILGFLPIIWSINEFSFSIFLYGLRDIILISLVIWITIARVKVPEKIIHFSYVIILFGVFFQFVVQYFYSDYLFESITNSRGYFESKGIKTNFNGGFFGSRIYFPLFSSSLIGTFLALHIFNLKKKISKVLVFVAGTITLSKAFFVLILLYSLKNRAKMVLLSLLLMFILPYVLILILEHQEVGIISFHISSILDRFNAFQYLIEGFFDVPDYLGSNSVAGYVLSGRDASEAAESLIIARILDFKVFIFLILPFIILFYTKMSKYQINFLSPIFFILLFSSLSNHPVAFLPLLLMKNRNI